MLVGLVANPASSKDVRRLTGLARVIDIEEKANLVARLLVGLGSVPGIEVLALDDRSGLVRRAVKQAGSPGAPVGYLPVEAEGSEVDTRNAASALADLAAKALVTVGGDGTVRAAAEGWPSAPLVPIAAGTNNAFALSDEPTVVGLATAIAVIEQPGAFVDTTAVEVHTSEGVATAVIDAVVVRNSWVGAGAIWEPGELVEALVTSSRRTAVGIASISAALGPLQSGHARHIRFGRNTTVRAVFGPGVVLDVAVADHEDLPIGTLVTLTADGGLVALDGERRLPAANGSASVINGPRILDLEVALQGF